MSFIDEIKNEIQNENKEAPAKSGQLPHADRLQEFIREELGFLKEEIRLRTVLSLNCFVSI